MPSHAIRLDLKIHVAVRTPFILLRMVWPLPRSLATTNGISVDFFSSPYLDVSVQAVPLIYLCIQYMMTAYCAAGLLHSDICGSPCICHSPQLFAAYHVLLRLPVPRHSPCALSHLTFYSLQIPLVSRIILSSFSYLSAIVVFYPLTKIKLIIIKFL